MTEQERDAELTTVRKEVVFTAGRVTTLAAHAARLAVLRAQDPDLALARVHELESALDALRDALSRARDLLRAGSR